MTDAEMKLKLRMQTRRWIEGKHFKVTVVNTRRDGIFGISKVFLSFCIQFKKDLGQLQNSKRVRLTNQQDRN